MNTNINLIEEELEEDLVHTVIDSLHNHHIDYCFSKKDLNSVLSLAKETGISLIYKIFNDKYGQLDYVEFIPAHFYVNLNGEKKYINKAYQFEFDKVPSNWKYDKKRREVVNKKSEIPQNMQKGKRKTIDYLAMAQGKEYLF